MSGSDPESANLIREFKGYYYQDLKRSRSELGGMSTADADPCDLGLHSSPSFLTKRPATDKSHNV